MAKYVIGNYKTPTDAERMVDNMLQQGYPRESLSLVANQTVFSQLENAGVVIEDDFEYEGADEGFWGRIKGFFASDEADEEMGQPATYRQDVYNGNVLVVVDEELVPQNLRETLHTAAGGQEPPPAQPQQTAGPNTDAETLQLQEEQLRVNKEAVQTGEVVVNKRVVQQEESRDVPVEREELVIERVPVDARQADADDFEDETITIPLQEEQVRVTKEPVVTEEIRIHKRRVEDTKHVTAQVRKEEVDVQKEGSAVINDAERAGSSQSAPPM